MLLSQVYLSCMLYLCTQQPSYHILHIINYIHRCWIVDFCSYPCSYNLKWQSKDLHHIRYFSVFLLSSLFCTLWKELWTNSREPKARNMLASVSHRNTSTPRVIVQLKAPPTLPTQPFITNFSNKSHPTLICSLLCWGERRWEESIQQCGCSSSAAMNPSSVKTSMCS